jgi:hypothetical protein
MANWFLKDLGKDRLAKYFYWLPKWRNIILINYSHAQMPPFFVKNRHWLEIDLFLTSVLHLFLFKDLNVPIVSDYIGESLYAFHM